MLAYAVFYRIDYIESDIPVLIYLPLSQNSLPDGEQDDRIKEINFGDWEMQRFDEITDANLHHGMSYHHMLLSWD